MAQLAHCPECKSEIVLPEAPAPGSWGQCPACNEQFALAEAIARPLPEVKVVEPPTDFPSASKEMDSSGGLKADDSAANDAEQELKDTLARTLAEMPAKTESSLSFGGTTLSSFLREQNESEPSSEQDEPAFPSDIASDERTPTLAELLAGGFEKDQPAAVDEDVEQADEAAELDTAELDTAELDTPESDADDVDTSAEEPSPEADRRKPTLSELFKFDQAAASSQQNLDENLDHNLDDAEDSAEFDSVSEAETPEPAATELPSSLTDFAAKIDALSNKISDDSKLDIPSFDFQVGDGQVGDGQVGDEIPSSTDEAAVDTSAIEDSSTETTAADDQHEPEEAPHLISGQAVVEPTINPLDVPQSTARSMRDTLDFDSPLEFESNSSYSATDELAFPHQSEGAEQNEGEQLPELAEPRGVVATRRSSSPSMLRTLTGVAGGGIVGLGAGYLVLLWILHLVGRTDDPLNVAQYYPNVVKPSTFQQHDELANNTALAAADQAAGDDLANDTEPNETGFGGADPLASADDQAADPLNDTAVRPAGFSQDATDRTELPDAKLEPLEPEPLDTKPLESEDEVLFPWEEAASAATPDPDPAIVIRNAPQYTAIEVEDLTQVGMASKPGLLEGNFQNPENAKVVPTKGASYAKLAKLAEAVTFAQLAGEIRNHQATAELFPSLFASQRHCTEIAQIAGYWLGSSKRGHGGIFFSGQPDSGTQRGSVAEYSFLLPTGQTMVVLTDEPLGESFESAGSVGVVGSVIDNPAERIEGYTGTADLAVWSTQLFPVDAR